MPNTPICDHRGQEPSTLRPLVLLATRNPGKLKELQTLLQHAPLILKLPAETGVTMPDVEETGLTFRENALLKANALAAVSGQWALADDSGLEVDALDGAPGIHSARYAGKGASDDANLQKLLTELQGTHRCRARYRCVLALIKPSGEVLTAEGALEGEIVAAPLGQGGFGYDPIFWLPRLGKTVAQLSFEDKQRLSHRAQAAQRLIELLPNF